MKHLKKFNESSEKFNFSDRDIIEFFYDFTDEDPDCLTIKDVMIHDNYVIAPTSYMKNPSKYKKAKLIQFTIGKSIPFQRPHGIINGTAACMTEFDKLKSAIEVIERFYKHIGEEVNYTINNEFNGLVIKFIISGGEMEQSESFVKEIDEYLKELKEILNKRGYKRVTIKNNSVEVLTPKKGGGFHSRYGDVSIDLREVVHKVQTGQVNLQNTTPTDKNKIALITWYNKVSASGFNLEISGGDHQALFKLNKRV